MSESYFIWSFSVYAIIVYCFWILLSLTWLLLIWLEKEVIDGIGWVFTFFWKVWFFLLYNYIESFGSELVMWNDVVFLCKFLWLVLTFLSKIFISKFKTIAWRTAARSIGIKLDLHEIFLSFQQFISHDDSSWAYSDFFFISAFDSLDGVSDSGHVLSQFVEVKLFWREFTVKCWLGPASKSNRCLNGVISLWFLRGVFAMNFRIGSFK